MILYTADILSKSIKYRYKYILHNVKHSKLWVGKINYFKTFYCSSVVSVYYWLLLVSGNTNFYYSQTIPQWPAWGQKKVAVVDRGPLWGGRGVI